ncbi:PREDICTED: putative transporter arsB [Amphimedon queenslandica]|nr:PREDICTED: putative transporter arsB [Amphimedon queenslandica]|eukprot:XP_019853690.1 PREDICTED: putative transporter arsB [Amphimedon queenslandica]
MAFEYLAPHMNLNTIEGVLLFSVFVIIGSNIFSNVPLVILIVGRVSDLCDDCGPLGGLLLAWISTIAGNFTLIGSVANLIVAEKARSSAEYRISFLGYFIFGFPSTLVILYACLPVVYFMGKLAAKI